MFEKSKHWAISSQASWEQVEGSTTNNEARTADKLTRVRDLHVCYTVPLVNNLGDSMAEKKFNLTEQELRGLYDKLGTALSVAKEIGVCKKTVLKNLKRYGIKRTGKKQLSDNDKQMITRMATDGYTASEISKVIGFSNVTINRYARKIGITIANNYHKGFVITDSGYKKLLRPNHTRADGKGYVGEHTLIMESYINRLLKNNEVVHHIDGDKLNNDISNLKLMTEQEHRSLHAKNGDCGFVKVHSKKI